MVTEKKCYHCGIVKSADEFGKDRRGPTGLKSRCNACQKEYNVAYIKKNKEKLRAHNKAYRVEHAERLREKDLEYYWNNRDKVLERNKKYRQGDDYKKKHAESMRKYRDARPEHYKEIAIRSRVKNREVINQRLRDRYKDNPEHYKKYAKKYREENHDRVLYWNRQRKMREQEIPGNHSFDQWLDLCSFFDNTCPCCNEKDVKLTVDHIIPISWDNTSNWITNIQAICGPCNSKKRNSHATDYRPEYVRAWALEQMNEN